MSLKFGRPVSRNRTELMHTLVLFNTNQKSHMGSLTVPLETIFSDIERSNWGHSDFESLYLVKP